MKRSLKVIASALVITFGMTMVPMSAFAAKTNEKNAQPISSKTTLTVAEAQSLVASHNNTAKKMGMTLAKLNEQKDSLKTQKDDLENSLNQQETQLENTINGINQGLQTVNTQISAVSKRIAELNAKAPSGLNPQEQMELQMKQKELQQLQAQKADLEMKKVSMQGQMGAMIEQTKGGIESLEDTLDKLNNNETDLTHAMGDLQTQMNYTTSSLCSNITQLKKVSSLLQNQVALSDKLLRVAELQKKLGMVISTDVEKQRQAKQEAQNNLTNNNNTLTTVKRTLNILMGRKAENPLDIVPAPLPKTVQPAPAFTQPLIDQFIKNDYKLQTLERDKNGKGSIDKQLIDLDIKERKDTVTNDLKTMLDNINKDGAAYNLSKQKLATEQKTYKFTKKRYQLGMISEIQLRSAELSLKNVEMANMQNGYQYQLSWEKYRAAEKGVDVSGLK